MASKQKETTIPKPDTAAYYRGLTDGIARYSWWENGIQLVGIRQAGTGIERLCEALAKVNAEEERANNA